MLLCLMHSFAAVRNQLLAHSSSHVPLFVYIKDTGFYQNTHTVFPLYGHTYHWMKNNIFVKTLNVNIIFS